MRSAAKTAILFAAICFLHASVAPAQEAPAEDAPPATDATSEPAVEESTPADDSSGSTVKAIPLDPNNLPDWALRALTQNPKQQQGDFLSVDDVCEVKHYRQERLQGFGLVLDLEAIVGQKSSSSRSDKTENVDAVELTQLLDLLNKVTGEGDIQSSVPEEFRGSDKMALISVTASVPPEGVRQGDRIDCEVQSFDGRSLQNGYLLTTQLFPPGPKTEAAAAIAAGPIVSVSSARSGPAKVSSGCLVKTDVADQFVMDGKITLVLAEEHADFLVAQGIVDAINKIAAMAADKPVAKALNRFNVEVTIPPPYAEDPVLFVTEVLALSTRIPAADVEQK